jgi:prolyl 4-hydroxylase
MAQKMLYPSGLAFAPGEKVDMEQQTRTSKGTFLSTQMDPAGVLAWVEERIAAVTLLPRENGEAFNVLKVRAFYNVLW